MNNEYLSKVFKSGNSMALRLPKALGIAEGTEMRLTEEAGRFTFEPVNRPKRKFNVDKIWGCASGSGLHLIAPDDRMFETRTLITDNLDWPANERQG